MNLELIGVQIKKMN